MKQQHKKRVCQASLGILLYSLLLSFCIAVVLAVPYISHAEFLNNLAEEAALEYAVTSDLDSIELHSLGALVYDVSGTCIDSRVPKFFYHANTAESIFGKWPSNALQRVLNGKTTRHIGFIFPNKVGVIYIGEPIYQQGTVSGAFFLIRDLHDLYPTLVGICIAYSLFFALAVACLHYSLQKKQKYLQLQSNYVANFSHDLKAPITSIKALAETLHADLVNDEETRHKYYSTIISEATNLQYAVAGILELSAMQNNQITVSKQSVILSDVIAPVIAKYKMLCYDMMIEFNIPISFSALPPVYTDAKSISRLLDILLDNAVKFVGPDGMVCLDVTSGAKCLTVCVRDNGCGIRPEDQTRIFDRFYMVDPSHGGKGNGLGLAIAKEIVTALGERLWVESAPDEGATFFFTIHLK